MLGLYNLRSQFRSNVKERADKITALTLMTLSWGLVAKGEVDDAVEMEKKSRKMLMKCYGGNKHHVHVTWALMYLYKYLSYTCYTIIKDKSNGIYLWCYYLHK